MAGDWIKLEVTTPDKPEVFLMAEMLKIDPDEVVGKLVRVWSWADQHLIDGNAVSVTQMLLDKKAGVTGFASAMMEVNWLVKTDNGVEFVNFDRHNGKSSKKRALTNRRVSDVREKKRNCNANSNAPSVTLAFTREEKRREEYIKPIVELKPDSDPLAVDAGKVLDYLISKSGRKFQHTPSHLKFINARLKEGNSVDDLKLVIDTKVGEWSADPKMQKYIRPSTLFNSEKFDGYLEDSLGSSTKANVASEIQAEIDRQLAMARGCN